MFSTDTKLPDAAVGPAGSNIFVLLPRRSRIALVAAHPAVFFFLALWMKMLGWTLTQ